MTNTATIIVKRHQLEPGTHISRRWIAVLETREIELPLEQISELRPDWGEFINPKVTFRAIERALRAAGELFSLPSDQTWSMSVKDDTSKLNELLAK